MSLKRTFDIVVAILVLATLAPLLLIVGVLVNLQSGRVVFASARKKYYGREVTVFRFPAEKCEESTRRFLVQSGADIIPCLYSVLRGDMSIVGPNFQTNVEVPPRYLEAFQSSPLKPGLIGPKAKRGATNLGSSQLDADFLYVSRWTF